jgi:glutathione S-transferase
MAIGKDVYCDTRCIIAKLEERFTDSSYLPLSSAQSKAFESLLDTLTTEGGGFARAAQLMPLNLPALNDQKFLKDREEMMGRSWQKDDIAKQRPEALAQMRRVFDTMESVLQDGRQWAAGTEKVSLADIQGQYRM